VPGLVLLLLVAGCLVPHRAAGQRAGAGQGAEREQTEARLQALQQQIREDQRRLKQAAAAETSARERLSQLQREIALREELVATYRERQAQLRAEQRRLQASLGRMTNRMDALRAEYRRRATHAYKYGRLHDLALILSAQSINQMLIRARYLHRFAEARRKQRAVLQRTASELRAQQDDLAASRDRLDGLLAEARAERTRLERLKTDRETVIARLRSERSTLEEELEAKRASAEALEARIQELIAASEAEARGQGAGRPAPSPEKLAAYANLSADFEANQGRLPWPAEGAVTEGFGNRVDPVHGTTTYHPGILIATRPRAPVRCIFDGEVSLLDFIPGYGDYLVVRHGEYLSVYSNFSTVYVREGQAVRAGQVLGQAGTSSEPRGAGLFFAVFDKSDGEATNPTRWLANR
jgi:septal ring factor EnvC (AmiA/AmiB activator)